MIFKIIYGLLYLYIVISKIPLSYRNKTILDRQYRYIIYLNIDIEKSDGYAKKVIFKSLEPGLKIMQVMKLYKAEEVSDLLGIKKQTVYQWISQGRLTGIKFSHKCLRFSQEDIDNFMKTQVRVGDKKNG